MAHRSVFCYCKFCKSAFIDAIAVQALGIAIGSEGVPVQSDGHSQSFHISGQ